MTEYKYFIIRELPRAEGKKTSIYDIIGKSNDDMLGYIKWHGSWRQYCFFPASNTFWSLGCLEDIKDYLKKLGGK